MKLVKLSLKTVAYIIAVVLLFIGLVIFINLPMFDEELNSDAAEILKITSMPAPKNNAYIAMLGLEAAIDQDMFSTGLQLLEQYRKNIDKNGLYSFITPLNEQDRKDILGIGNDEIWRTWRELYSTRKICGFDEATDCLSRLIRFIQKNPIEAPRLKFLFERYDQLLTLTNYKSPNKVTFQTGLMARHASNYARIKLASLYGLQKNNEFLHFLKKDLSYRRMVLLKSESLIDKMVSLSSIKQDFSFLSHFIRENNLSNVEKEKMVEILTHLSKEELDISKSFEHEFKLLDYYIKQSFHINGVWWSGFQLNASLNDTYINTTEPLKCISKLTANRFYNLYKKQSTESVCNQDRLDKNFGFSLTNLYNLAYKMNRGSSLSQYSDYIAKAHDTNGMINLLQLQLQLKSVSKNLRTEFVQNSDIRNPYTNKPLEFNENTGILKFNCLSKTFQDDCHVRM